MRYSFRFLAAESAFVIVLEGMPFPAICCPKLPVQGDPEEEFDPRQYLSLPKLLAPSNDVESAKKAR
jgi:hypothetical protein